MLMEYKKEKKNSPVLIINWMVNFLKNKKVILLVQRSTHINQHFLSIT